MTILSPSRPWLAVMPTSDLPRLLFRGEANRRRDAGEDDGDKGEDANDDVSIVDNQVACWKAYR